MSAHPARFGLCDCVFAALTGFGQTAAGLFCSLACSLACAQVGVRLVLDDGTGPQPVGVGFAGEVRWGPQVQSILN